MKKRIPEYNHESTEEETNELIERVKNAPERKIFYIDTGDKSLEEINEIIEDIKTNVPKKDI